MTARRRFRPRRLEDLTPARRSVLLRAQVRPVTPTLPDEPSEGTLPVVRPVDEAPVFLAPVARRGP